jgi:hypothetical protein
MTYSGEPVAITIRGLLLLLLLQTPLFSKSQNRRKLGNLLLAYPSSPKWSNRNPLRAAAAYRLSTIQVLREFPPRIWSAFSFQVSHGWMGRGGKLFQE